MKRSILLIITIFIAPIWLMSQDNKETLLSIGISSAKYNKHFSPGELSPLSLFVGINRSWNKKDNESFSFSKQIGLGLKYTDLSRESGGIAARSIYGTQYFYTFFNASYMIQKRFSESIRIQIGPRIEGLIVGYEKGERTGWGMPDSDGNIMYYGGDKEYSEFNREYFDQLYYGSEVKFLSLTNDGESSIGFSFSYLFTKETESNFETSSMVSFTTFIEL